jgi:hypothetical protein
MRKPLRGSASGFRVSGYAARVKTPLIAASALLITVSACKSDPKPEAAGSSAPPQVAAPAESPLGALKNFEGEIGVLVKTTTQTTPVPPMILTVKGSKVRVDVPAGMNAPGLGEKTHLVLDAPAKQLYAIVDDQKQVVRLELDKLGEQFKSMKPPGAAPEAEKAPAAPPKITKTGRTNVVAGYKCEEWDIVSPKGERAQVCVASEGASFFEVPTVGLPPDQVWAKELFDGQHLPLRFIAYDAAGGEETRMEVTRLERKTIADTAFAIPADYAVVDLAQLIKNLTGALGGPAGLRPLAPGASAYPPGAQIPPGMALPKDFKLPPGVTLPPGMQAPKTAEEAMKMLQERARAAASANAQAPK